MPKRSEKKRATGGRQSTLVGPKPATTANRKIEQTDEQRALALLLIVVQQRCDVTFSEIAEKVFKRRSSAEWARTLTAYAEQQRRHWRATKTTHKTIERILSGFRTSQTGIPETMAQELKEVLVGTIRSNRFFRKDLAQLHPLLAALNIPTLSLGHNDDRTMRTADFIRLLRLDPTENSSASIYPLIGGFWFIVRLSTYQPNPLRDKFNVSLLNILPKIYHRRIRAASDDPNGVFEEIRASTCLFTIHSHRDASDAAEKPESREPQTFRGLVLKTDTEVTFFGTGEKNSRPISMVWGKPKRGQQYHAVQAHGIITTENADQQTVAGPVFACAVPAFFPIVDQFSTSKDYKDKNLNEWTREAEIQIKALLPHVKQYDGDSLFNLLNINCSKGVAQEAIDHLFGERHNISKTSKSGYYVVRPYTTHAQDHSER